MDTHGKYHAPNRLFKPMIITVYTLSSYITILHTRFLQKIFTAFIISIYFLAAGCAYKPDIISPFDREDSELVVHLQVLKSQRFYQGAPPLSGDVFPFVLQKEYQSYREFLIDDGFECDGSICVFTSLKYVDDSMTQRDLNAYFVTVWMIEIRSDDVRRSDDVEVTQFNFMHRRVDG